MEIFYQCYGAEAGLAGLKWLPYGGLYLTGKYLRHVQAALEIVDNFVLRNFNRNVYEYVIAVQCGDF